MNKNHTNQLTFQQMDPGNSLALALTKKPEEVINEVIKSGLRGRGGAGFPTGLKWRLCANKKDEQHIIICNADEGEPGTFKDRYLLSTYPELVFESIAIAGYAIRASKGFLYLREEYQYLLPVLQETLRKMKPELDKIAMTIEIRMGAGAYVCGEETALIESLEGQRGEPRDRPPYPVIDGFQHHPTIVNNVETLAWICPIMSKGYYWFKDFGTEQSAGLKLFSVSGDCTNPGVYEFPMGIQIKEVLKEIDAEDAKALQVGGASGYCIPASEFNRYLCFEDVSTSGAIIVFGPERDMLKVAHNFLEFFVDESCGQCTPCREGNVKLLEGIERLMKCECTSAELDELISLGHTMQVASKCGMGQSSPNAFLSICEHFRAEIMSRLPE